METILAMLLTLPFRHGGYNFEKPLLNHTIEVKERHSSGRNAVRPITVDIYWPDNGIALEYDSKAFHSTEEQRVKDSSR